MPKFLTQYFSPHHLKAIISWCIYDWGISAFPVVITTFITATYFTSKIASDPISGTHAWGMAMAIAGLVTAMLSPPIGAIADHSGGLKKGLGLLTLVMGVSAALLWYAYPSQHFLFFTLCCVVVGTISLNLSMVFYNAMLTYLVPSRYVGRISGWGWGLGYLGGLAILLIAFYGLINTNFLRLDQATYEPVRLCGPLVAIWIFIFAFPLFLFFPEKPAGHQEPMGRAIYLGLTGLTYTLKHIWYQKNIFTFLFAQLIYIDGLNTLFAFGGIYAVGTFHLSISEVLLFGIVMNAFAGVGSIIFAWIDDWLGAKTTILITLAGLTFFGFSLVLTTHVWFFWLFSSLLSLFVGPVQSSSRSLMTHLTPKEKATEFFGFYILSGKLTTFIGPWLLATMTLHFDSQRVGMGSVLFFFIIGGCVLLRVRLRDE